jgi:3'-5' exoribonuclease
MGRRRMGRGVVDAPMKSQYVHDLKDKSVVASTFLVLEKEERKKKDGTPYLQIKLSDKTGTLRAKCWERVKEMAALFNVGDIVYVKGETEVYHDNLELSLVFGNVRRCLQSEVLWSDYIKTTDKDIESMFSEMKGEVLLFKNEHLKKLLLLFFDDAEFASSFKKTPGAKIHHHNYVGGLLEHTYAVFSICKAFSSIYNELDRELLLAGAMLHDIGKIRDYTYKLNIDITDSGGLVGHIISGNEMLAEKISRIPEFPEELGLKLRHLIVSHHNTGEWGSPVEPRFSEAAALHYADLADSHISQFISIEEDEKGKERTSSWSSFSHSLQRMLYLGKKK